MQDDRVKVWLQDILTSIEEINDFVSNMSEEVYMKDIKTRRAVERDITIIGEAMDRILKVNPTVNITDSRKIVDTRNRIMHGYESIYQDAVWFIIYHNLPILKKEVEVMLSLY